MIEDIYNPLNNEMSLYYENENEINYDDLFKKNQFYYSNEIKNDSPLEEYYKQNSILNSNKDEINKNIFQITTSLNKKKKKINDLEKLKKNAECAKRSRARKKELINNLYKENIRLKLENKELKKIIESKICEKCKEIIYKSNPKNIQINNNNSNINKKLFLFSTFTISLFIIIFYSMPPIENFVLRKLNQFNDIFDPKFNNLKIKNLTLVSMYVLLGDYYSLVQKKSFLYNENNIIYSYKNKGKVRIIKENDITNSEINDCMECLVELNQENLVINKSKDNLFHFKLMLNPKIININETNYEIKHEKGSPLTVYEIDCSGLGYSKNLVYFNN